jgi:hypothetical protein
MDLNRIGAQLCFDKLKNLKRPALIQSGQVFFCPAGNDWLNKMNDV